MKPVPQYEAKVEQQLPAVDGVAVFRGVGQTFGTHEECWKAAKKMTRYPVITMKEIHHGQKC